MVETLGLRFLIFLLYLECVKPDSCFFPEFLQSKKKHGRLQPWITRSWWINIREKPKMLEQREIFVEGSKMWVTYKKDNINCERKNRRFTPYETVNQRDNCATRKHFNRTCLLQENNKYRVAQSDENGFQYVYACMSFTLRSSNVIQITEGNWRSTNAPDLCDEENLAMDDWPWIASWDPEPTPCPISGGFTFRTISRLTNQDVCKDDWRRSKLEIECMKGDGMDFFAPKGSSCNPFVLQGEWKRLHCLGGWTHGNFSFMVTADDENKHRFCLRIPLNAGKHFMALLYFSPICPIDRDGQPETGIDYYELHLKRTDYGECEDENEQFCKEHAEKGMCDKTSNNYLPHCSKSCGLCGANDNAWRDVNFSPLVRGKWLLFDQGREENVIINKTHLYFSDLGHFQCLERAPDEDLYKLISSFQNGCSTRYTCIQLHRPHNNILQFRLGRSFREDKNHIEICNFRKDFHKEKNKDNIRSLSRRNLLLQGQLWPTPCRVSGKVPFHAYLNGQKCKGNFSDWNPNTCSYNTHITMTDNCFGREREYEYKCIAYLEDEFHLSDKMSSKMILTQSMDGTEEFVCWILTTFPGEDFNFPVTRMYKMPSLQCSSFENVNEHLQNSKHVYYHMLYEMKSKATVCEHTNPILSKLQQDENVSYTVGAQITLQSKPATKRPVLPTKFPRSRGNKIHVVFVPVVVLILNILLIL